MEIYLDWVRFPLGPQGIDIIDPQTIEAIEVYVGAAQPPVRFSRRNARCSVVVIWTRDGTP